MAEGNVKWGSTEKAYRTPAEGMRGYYEPDNVSRDGEVISFKIYRSADPAVQDILGSYMVNCDTKELVTIEKGQPTPPMKLLAGEQLYSVSAKFCEWSKKGFLDSYR